MQPLNKEMVLNGIQQAIIVHKEIEIIDWNNIENPFISGTHNYNGIIMHTDSAVELHYSVLHKIFPYILKSISISDVKHACFRALIALCYLNGLNIKLTSHSNFFDSIQLPYLDSNGLKMLNYLDLLFESSECGKKTFTHISCCDSRKGNTYKHSDYTSLLNKFLLPILHDDSKEFNMSFKSIDDLTDDNLLILSALTL